MITRERLAELRAMLSTEPSDMEWMVGGCDGSIRQTELTALLDAAERLAEVEAERDRLQSQLAKAVAALRELSDEDLRKRHTTGGRPMSDFDEHCRRWCDACRVRRDHGELARNILAELDASQEAPDD